MKKQLSCIYLLLLLLGLSNHVAAQTSFATEDELKTHAASLFDDDEFEEAYPLYSQLLSIYPKDPNYNYRLGVCMLYASDDKEKAIPFLEFASKKTEVEKEVFFYLAKAYHLNYRFDDAIAQYLQYEKVASDAKEKKLQVDRQIQMCKNGKKLLRNLSDLVVIDKKEMTRLDFYRAYDISDLGGKLLLKPDEPAFKTSVDKKKKDKSIIYFAANNNQVYFSSYGDNVDNGKDIYVIHKLSNGEWSKPQTLGAPVNTEYDEDYPFLHPNGKVLYFCSKGHNSMGGYDVFKSTLDPKTNTWGTPVNLDFPINTPDDDILYVTNQDEKEAFFSSARASAIGMTSVYHINVERKPIDVTIIKGLVVKNRDNQALDLKITVKDLTENSILGIYNSKAETGDYLINLPNGGKFMYTVEAAGFETQSGVVEVPFQNVFKPLKQEISYETGTDKLIITNKFDEAVDDESYMLALNFIKERAKMKVSDTVNEASSGGNDVTKTDDTGTQNSTSQPADNQDKTTAPNASLSNNDIIKIAYDDAKEADTEAKDLQEQADISLNLASQKNELAQNKTRESKQLMEDASKMDDNVKKQATVDEAKTASNEADQLNQETVAAFNLAKKLQSKATAKQNEADLSQQYAKDLETAVKSKNSKEAMAKLDEQQKKLEVLSQQNDAGTSIAGSIKMDVENKKKELDKAVKQSADIKQEITDNETLIAKAQADADKEKNDKIKQGLLQQIQGLKSDNEESKKDLVASEQKVNELQKEYNGAINESELVSNIIDKAKTGTGETAAANVATIDKSKLEQQVNEIKNAPLPDKTVATIKNDNTNDNVKTTTAANTDKSDVTDNKQANNETTVTDNPVKTGDITKTETSDRDVNESTSDATNASGISYDKKYANELAVINNMKNEADREHKKAELYKKWAKSINDDLALKKYNLKSEQDKGKKKELSQQIAALDKELKSKQEIEATVFANAENLKDQRTAAADEPLDMSSGTTGNVPASSKNEQTASADQPYLQQLADANAIADEADREKTKAEVLKKWSASIDNDVVKQKQDVERSTRPEEKAVLAKKISDSEQLSKEKLAEADQRLAKAERLKNVGDNNTTTTDNSTNLPTTDNQTVPANTVTSANNSTSDNPDESATGSNKAKPANNSASPVAINLKLANEIASAENISDEREKETKKSEAFKKYVAEATNAVSSKQAELKSENDDNKKKELAADIATLESNIAEKQKLADDTDRKIKTLPISQTAASSESQSPVAINLKLVDELVAAESITDETEKETKKSEAFKKYVAQATTALNSKQVELKSENDENKKKELTADIATFESNIAEKQKLADDTDRKIKTLPKSQNLASNPESPAAINLELVNEIASAENITDETEKETKKSEAFKKYVAQATTALNSKQTELKSEKNVTKKKGLEQDIATLQSNITEKQKLADDTDLKIKTLKQSPVITATKPLTADSATAVNPNPDNSVSQPGFTYSSPAATEQAAKANTLNQQAEDLANQSKELKSKAVAPENSAEKDADFARAEELSKQSQAKKLEAADIIAATNKTEFIDNQNQLEQYASANATNQANDISMAEMMKDEAKTYFDKAQKSRMEAATANTFYEKGAAVDDAYNNEMIALEKQKKAADIYKKYNGNAVIPAANNSANNAIAANDKQQIKVDTLGTLPALSENIPAITDSVSEVTNANQFTNNTQTKAADHQLPETDVAAILTPNEKFVKKATPVYSAAKPIPVNEKLPEGLIFKVQIGAFRNPIPQDLFKGISPITGETTPQGFIRYTAGIFVKFETADKIKDEIRGLGYKDAFVVAFLNGKRISMTEALRLAGTNSSQVVAPAETINQVQTQTPVTTASEQSSATPTVKNNIINQAAVIAETQSITLVTGLFYTIQIGVYSQPVSAAKLYGIQPLYTETAPNGNIRYNTGIYNDLARANEAKNMIVDAGIKDAFVTVYQNGKRISVPDATQAINQGTAVFSTAPNMNVLPTFSNNKGIQNKLPKTTPTPLIKNEPQQTAPVKNTDEETKPKEQPVIKNEPSQPQAVTETPVEPAETETIQQLETAVIQNNSMPIDSGIVFKIQIGAFKDEVPIDIANKFLKIAKKGIKNYRDDNGLTIYTVGNYKTYDEAVQEETEVALQVEDVFVVAFNNGKKITVEEAKALISK